MTAPPPPPDVGPPAAAPWPERSGPTRWIVAAWILAVQVEKARLSESRLGRTWLVVVPVSFVASYAFMVATLQGQGSDLATLLTTVAVGFGLFQPLRIALAMASQGDRSLRNESETVDLPRWFGGVHAAARVGVRAAAYPLLGVVVVAAARGAAQAAALLLVTLGYLAWLTAVAVVVARLAQPLPDVREVVSLVSRALLVLSPVLYGPEQIADRFGTLAATLRIVNPAYGWLEAAHGVADGLAPSLTTIIAVAAWTVLTAGIATAVTRPTRDPARRIGARPDPDPAGGAPARLVMDDAVVDVGTGASGHRVGPTSLDLGSGDRVAIVAPSGAGKSVLLRAMAGTLPLAGGTVSASSPPMLFSPTSLLRGKMSVADALTVVCALHGTSSPRSAARHVLQRLGAESMAGREVASLTSAERSILAYGTALVVRPRILLLDNPGMPSTDRFEVDVADLLADLIGRADIVVAAVPTSRRAERLGLASRDLSGGALEDAPSGGDDEADDDPVDHDGQDMEVVE